MKSLSSVDIHYLTKELQYLVNARLDKIFMPDKKELLIQLHVPGKGKILLRIVAGKLFYTTMHKPEAKDPSGFCMYLRKHVSGRLRRICQLESERIIQLEFENRSGTISIIIELYGKGNIVITKANQIINVAERQAYKDRQVKQKIEYIYPHQRYNFKTIDEKMLKHLLETSEKESTVKALAIDLGLGGKYAEQIATHKDQRPVTGDFKTIFNNLLVLREANKSINDDLDHLYTKESLQQLENQSKESKTYKKYQKIIETQSKTLEELQKKEQENTAIAETIYTHYQEIDNILKELNVINKKYPLQEMKTVLKNHKTVKDIDAKDKTVTLKL